MTNLEDIWSGRSNHFAFIHCKVRKLDESLNVVTLPTKSYFMCVRLG